MLCFSHDVFKISKDFFLCNIIWNLILLYEKSKKQLLPFFLSRYEWQKERQRLIKIIQILKECLKFFAILTYLFYFLITWTMTYIRRDIKKTKTLLYARRVMFLRSKLLWYIQILYNKTRFIRTRNIILNFKIFINFHCLKK